MSDERSADPKLVRELIAALKRCTDCLDDELSAAGPDEVKQHPTFREHSNAVDQARRVLAKVPK